MRVLFLHLSDIHIEKKSDINVPNVYKIIESLCSIKPFEKIVLLISGDVAYSGTKEQYDTAWKLFSTIINACKRSFNIDKIDVAVVPGNHDIEYGSSDLGHVRIQELFKKNIIEQEIDKELNKQEKFMNFAKGNKCFITGDKLFYTKIIKCGDKTIKCNLINSAIFSTLDEDKGLHYLPKSILADIEHQELNNYNITIMHHSYHWYNDIVKGDIEKALYKKSNIIFYGHEHNMGTIKNDYDGYKVVFLAGGELCNRGNWDKSEFYANILDTDTDQLWSQQFIWNKKEKIYEKGRFKIFPLREDTNIGSLFLLKEEFNKNFYRDEVNNISLDFNNYFVFPALEEQNFISKKEAMVVQEKAGFLNAINEQTVTSIIGSSGAGKTLFLKHLFKELSNEYVCIFIDGAEVNTYNFEKIIKKAFSEIYVDAKISFNRFEQMSADKKILLIDNVNKISSQAFTSFLEKTRTIFGKIIYSTKEIIEIDPSERIKHHLEDLNVQTYKILPFYAEKRKGLVEKIVNITVPNDYEQQQDITNRLVSVLKSQRRLFSLDPAFIIQFTDYYCKNIKDTSQNDGSIFSKVFEANIINSITPHTKDLSVDKIMILLDKLAYWAYRNKQPLIKQKVFMELIVDYNEKYDDEVNVLEFIDIVVKTRILGKGKKNDEYRFNDKNKLAYFTSREIIRRWQDEGTQEDIVNLLTYSCFGINADIILFITYITDNLYLLNLILDKTIEFSSEWIEFELDKINIPYLEQMNKKIELSAPTDKDKQEVTKKEIEEEKKELKKSALITNDYLDYNEEESEEIFNQLMRAIALLNIVSKSLPSFEHRLRREEKQKIIDIIYKLPQQIFYIWAYSVEQEKEKLIEELKEQYSAIYLEENTTEEDILYFLQLESIALLLELMNISVSNAMKNNTKRYLDNYNFKSKFTYSMLHFMGIGKIDSPKEFISEAKDIMQMVKHPVSELMHKRIVKNYIINSNNASLKNIQQLNDTYFPTKIQNKSIQNILIERHKKSKRC